MSSGKACFSALRMSSVTINPRLTASRDETQPASLVTFNVAGRYSLIIDDLRLSHNIVRYGAIAMGPAAPETCRCNGTAATDMTRLWHPATHGGSLPISPSAISSG